jgi:hypothetical protein
MSKGWPGEVELVGVFDALGAGADEGISLTSHLKAVVKACLKHQKEYKMVVFETEKFMLKASDEGKVAAVYVIDTVCRKETQGKAKENFCARYASRFKQIFASLEKLNETNRLIVAKIVYQWRKRSVFPPSTTMPKYDDLKDVIEGTTKPVPPTKDNSSSQSTSGDKNAATKSKVVVKKTFNKERTIKFCAFREGSCPFGDKCRFRHVEHGVHDQYMVTRGNSKKIPAHASDSREDMEYARIETGDMPSTKDITNVGMIVADTAFPMKRKTETKEDINFKRNKLAHAYAVQDQVTFSWMKESSLASIL